MRRDHVRLAVTARDDGLRRISRLTWWIGMAAAACSAVIALAFGHHAAASQAPGGSQGGIQVPAQPPAPGHGGVHVRSGGS
jgi:hypothetical protein